MWIQDVGPERQRGEAPGENAVELELDEGSHDVKELVHFLTIEINDSISTSGWHLARKIWQDLSE